MPLCHAPTGRRAKRALPGPSRSFSLVLVPELLDSDPKRSQPIQKPHAGSEGPFKISFNVNTSQKNLSFTVFVGPNCLTKQWLG